MRISKQAILSPITTIAALSLLAIAMGGTWQTVNANPPPASARLAAGDAPPLHPASRKMNRKDLAGKVNLNAASEDQLMLLPTIGPAKAERIVAWRKKNGSFKRIADLRRVKGFGYKTFKRLEPFLDIQGETTLAAK